MVKETTKLRTINAIANDKDLIINGTGTNVEKMYKQIKELQAEGYEVEILYVKVALKTVLERNAKKRERTVPENIVYEKYDTITYAFEILSGIADIVSVVEND